MPKCVKSVTYNDGEHKCFAIVLKHLENGNLNVTYQDPATGSFQIATDVPEGEGGHTYTDE